jgi:hypothetical protein
MNPFKRTHTTQKRVMLLRDALHELVALNIATIKDDKFVYSSDFEDTCQKIVSSPLSKLKQLSIGRRAGEALLPQILAQAASHPNRRDIDNLITAYVCLHVHIEDFSIHVDKKLMPDLAYAVWYLNDNEPTQKEVEEWALQIS